MKSRFCPPMRDFLGPMVFAVLTLSAFGAPGDLDLTFGGGTGIAITDLSESHGGADAKDLAPSAPDAVLVADVKITALPPARLKGRVTASDLEATTFKISAETGVFSGSFKHPDPAVTAPVRFKGILRRLEDPPGRGNFRGPNNAGSVRVIKSR